MDRAWLRFAQKLEYRDPVPLLRNLRKVEQQIATSNTPEKIKKLRTNGLKEFREIREAAMFDPVELVVPDLNIAELWIFGALEPDQSIWGLWGNFMETHTLTRYSYPV